MSKPFVPKAGTTAECAAFTGLENEVVLDEEKGSLIVHDGVTVGGAHEILPKGQNDELYASKDILKIPYQVNVDLNTLIKTGVYAVHALDPEGGNDGLYAQEYLHFHEGMGVNCLVQVFQSNQADATSELGGVTANLVRQVVYRVGTVGSNDDNIYSRTGRLLVGQTEWEWGQWYQVLNTDFIFSSDSNDGTQRFLVMYGKNLSTSAYPSANHYFGMLFSDGKRVPGVANRFGALECTVTNDQSALWLRAYSPSRNRADLAVVAKDDELWAEFEGARLVTAYMAGDSTYTDSAYFGGTISAGSTQILVTIPISKPIYASKVSFTGKFSVRQNGNYLAQNLVAEDYLSDAAIRPTGIQMTFTKSDKWAGATNNDALCVQIYGTFSFS